MKWMIRKRLVSDWMDEWYRDSKVWKSPCVYLAFVKGISVDKRINQNILDRVRLVVEENELEPVVNALRFGRSIQ